MNTTSACEWSARLAELLACERNAMVEFLVELAEFDRQRAWVELGHANLFAYLHAELGMSRGAAHYRKTVVALIQKFPDIVEHLRDGRLCVTAAVEMAKVLTEENWDYELPRFFHLGRREAKAIAVELSPVQPVERDRVEPLTPEYQRLEITVSNEFVAELERAREVLSHKYPDGKLEDILREGLKLILKQEARGGNIPRAVKRAVQKRDGGACQWPRSDGAVCGSRYQIEFDHIQPRAVGGEDSVENLRLLCRFHNQLAAKRVFGERFMSQFATAS